MARVMKHGKLPMVVLNSTTMGSKAANISLKHNDNKNKKIIKELRLWDERSEC